MKLGGVCSPILSFMALLFVVLLAGAVFILELYIPILEARPFFVLYSVSLEALHSLEREQTLIWALCEC